LNESATKSAQENGARDGLALSLGFFSMVMLVIGGVIGSGIFRKPGVMMAELASPGLLLMVWLLAGVVTYLGVLTNAEIASFISETGGQYVYFERMYGPFVAFLYGWGAFVVIQTGSISALAYVFAEYTAKFVPLPEAAPALANFVLHFPLLGDITPFRELGVKALASGVIILLTIVNYLGARAGSWTTNLFTLAKLGGMAALVVLVIWPGNGGSVQNFTSPSATIHKEGFALLAAIVAAMQGAFWGYDGWVKASYIAGEVKNAQRVVPLASMIGMAAVTLIYIVMSGAYCWALPADVMAQSKLVAADAAEHAASGAGRWIAALVMISTFGTTNAVILASARIYYSMANRGVFPKALGRAHPRFHTPSAALVAQGAWGVILVFSGTFDMLTDTLVFVAWIFYAIGAFGVFILRRREPDAPRGFKVPAYPIVPAVFVVFAAIFVVMTVYNDLSAYNAARAAGRPALINSFFGAGLVLLGTPLFFYFRARNKRSSAAL
jgi:basic amino acid/polyamine antiporter, APA family